MVNVYSWFIMEKDTHSRYKDAQMCTQVYTRIDTQAKDTCVDKKCTGKYTSTQAITIQISHTHK